MRLPRTISGLLAALMLAALPAQATTPAHNMLELRSLLGDWIGRSGDGEMVRASFRLASDGRVVQTLRARHTGLIGIYGNGAASVSAARLAPARPAAHPAPPAVAPVAIAAAAAPDNVSFLVEDGGHHTERWTWRDGSRVHTTVFYFTRESEMF